MPDFRPPPGPGSEVVLLGRVSRDDSDWGMSPKGQMTRGKKQSAQRRWLIAYEFEEVGSASRHGTKPRRHWEQCQRLARGEEGAVRVFMIDRPNRLSRIGSAGIKFLEDCRDSGIWIHIIKENDTYDLRIPGKFELLCHAMVKAAADSDETSAAVTDGKQSARELGRPDGREPWGYRRVYRPSAAHPGQLEYVSMEATPGPAPVRPGFPQAPPRAELVLEIIRRVAAHWSYTSVKRSLEDRGILSPRGRERWDVGTIKVIAANPVYLGLVPLEPATYGAAGARTQRPVRKFGTYDENDENAFARGNWPPIVTGEDVKAFWAAVAVVTEKDTPAAERRQAFGGGSVERGGSKLNRKVTHLLTYGGMRCGYVWPEGEVTRKTVVWGTRIPDSPARPRLTPGTVCGSDLRYGGKVRGRPYLTCDERGHNTVPEAAADAHVTGLVQARIAWLLRVGFDGRGGVELLRLREDRAAVLARLRENEAELENPRSEAPVAALNRAIARLTGQLGELEEKIRKAAVPVCLADYGDLPSGPDVTDEELAESIARVWDKATVEARRAVLRGTAESLTLLPGLHGYQSRHQDISERIVPAWLPAERFVSATGPAGGDSAQAADGGERITDAATGAVLYPPAE